MHSPSAFRLLKRVVKPRKDAEYYAETDLRLRDASPELTRRACILLRLAAEVQPAFVWVAGKLPMVMVDALSLAGGIIRIYNEDTYPAEIRKSELIVVYKSTLTKARLQEALAAGKTVVGFGVSKKFMGSVRNTLKSGIMLEGVQSFIAQSHEGDALHFYEISKF